MTPSGCPPRCSPRRSRSSPDAIQSGPVSKEQHGRGRVLELDRWWHGVSRRGQQCDCATTPSKDRHERGPAALGRTGSGACARRGPALSPKISGATLGLGPGGGLGMVRSPQESWEDLNQWRSPHQAHTGCRADADTQRTGCPPEEIYRRCDDRAPGASAGLSLGAPVRVLHSSLSSSSARNSSSVRPSSALRHAGQPFI